MNRKSRTNQIVKVGIMSAVAFVVMFLQTPPMFSTFLKFDFSDVVALIGAFAIAPWAGIAIQLIKNLLHLPLSETLYVGELGNFIVGVGLVYPAALVYWKNKTKKNAVVALGVGVLSMTLVGMLANYFVLLPLYAKVLGFTMEMVVGATQVVNPYVTDKMSFIIYAIAPFNLLKSLMVSLITLLTYKYLQPIINGK